MNLGLLNLGLLILNSIGSGANLWIGLKNDNILNFILGFFCGACALLNLIFVKKELDKVE